MSQRSAGLRSRHYDRLIIDHQLDLNVPRQTWRIKSRAVGCTSLRDSMGMGCWIIWLCNIDLSSDGSLLPKGHCRQCTRSTMHGPREWAPLTIPKNKKYNTIPNPQQSTAELWVQPKRISGAWYCIKPRSKAVAEAVPRVLAEAGRNSAQSKFVNTKWPSASSIMLAGFRSLWMMPTSCKPEIADTCPL